MKYTREILKDVEGYVPGEQPRRGNVIKLNTNENPYPPSPRVLDAIQKLGPEALRKYPDPLALKLREACAARYGYDSAGWVVAGNGMDELLALAVRAFVDPGDTILTTYPTYTLYETLAQLHGASIVKVDLDEDFALTDRFFATPARLCFLPRPNAPSGGICAALESVERFCQDFDGIVVIDEAYVDFAETNCIDLPQRFSNVIVMRTFSKAFSLAGARLGVAVAHPDIVAEFLKTKDSYNINAFTQAAGLAAIEDYAHMQANAARICATRERLSEALRSMGFTLPRSQTNFVLAHWAGKPAAREIFARLRDQGIYVRYFDAPRLRDALRITIGTDSEVDALLNALRAICGPAA